MKAIGIALIAIGIGLGIASEMELRRQSSTVEQQSELLKQQNAIIEMIDCIPRTTGEIAQISLDEKGNFHCEIHRRTNDWRPSSAGRQRT